MRKSPYQMIGGEAAVEAVAMAQPTVDLISAGAAGISRKIVYDAQVDSFTVGRMIRSQVSSHDPRVSRVGST